MVCFDEQLAFLSAVCVYLHVIWQFCDEMKFRKYFFRGLSLNIYLFICNSWTRRHVNSWNNRFRKYLTTFQHDYAPFHTSNVLVPRQKLSQKQKLYRIWWESYFWNKFISNVQSNSNFWWILNCYLSMILLDDNSDARW